MVSFVRRWAELRSVRLCRISPRGKRDRRWICPDRRELTQGEQGSGREDLTVSGDDRVPSGRQDIELGNHDRNHYGSVSSVSPRKIETNKYRSRIYIIRPKKRLSAT
jgi:hypothetical protein